MKKLLLLLTLALTTPLAFSMQPRMQVHVDRDGIDLDRLERDINAEMVHLRALGSFVAKTERHFGFPSSSPHRYDSPAARQRQVRNAEDVNARQQTSRRYYAAPQQRERSQASVENDEILDDLRQSMRAQSDSLNQQLRDAIAAVNNHDADTNGTQPSEQNEPLPTSCRELITLNLQCLDELREIIVEEQKLENALEKTTNDHAKQVIIQQLQELTKKRLKTGKMWAKSGKAINSNYSSQERQQTWNQVKAERAGNNPQPNTPPLDDAHKPVQNPTKNDSQKNTSSDSSDATWSTSTQIVVAVLGISSTIIFVKKILPTLIEKAQKCWNICSSKKQKTTDQADVDTPTEKTLA